MTNVDQIGQHRFKGVTLEKLVIILKVRFTSDFLTKSDIGHELIGLVYSICHLVLVLSLSNSKLPQTPALKSISATSLQILEQILGWFPHL